MAFPHSLERSAEAGLPVPFWQGVSVTNEPGHVQVLSIEQAQSSRWSLSTSGTPHESMFPVNAKNLSRTRSSSLRAKSLYETDVRRKRTFLVKHSNRRADPILASTKFEALRPRAQGLTVTIGLKEGINADTTNPIYITPVPSSTERSVSSTGHDRRWKKRKNSLSRLVNYPTKILGMILPRRSDNPKQIPSVIPPKIVLPSPEPSLRRAETTIRRPKRSCELQRPDQSTTRWSIASTMAVRGERFSQSLDLLRPNLIDPPETQRSLVPPPPPPKKDRPSPPPIPVSALTRSKTQPAKSRPEPNKPVSIKGPRPPKRNLSERRSPRSGGPSLTLLGSALASASDSHLPISQEKKEMSLETVASIANRIAARELHEQRAHDSWDFLDYYSQSSGRGEKT